MFSHMWLALPILLALALTGCDPCAGVVACEGSPLVSYEGQIVRHGSGEPVAGVRVEFQRTGGIEVETDSFSVITDANGRFRITTEARTEGDVIADLIVHPAAPLESYRIEDLALSTTRVRGDGKFFPDRWVVDPYIDYRGELFLRGTGGPPPTSLVEFRRTGGISVEPDTFQVFSDGKTGRFNIRTRALTSGELRGELLVRVPGLTGEYEVSGVRVSTRYQEGDATFIGRWAVGPHLPYAGLLRYADSLEPAADVEVEVRRTGGIEMQPERYVTRTNQFGTFSIGGRVVNEGEVVVELVVRPGAPYRQFTIPEVRLATTGKDVQGVLIGQWMIPRE